MPRQLTGPIVLATHNPGKLKELREMLAPYGIEAQSAGELDLAEPAETGKTFSTNARIKALAAARAAGKPAFADDSGLVIDALDGAPGIQSARWAGPDKDFRFAMNKVQTLLIERGARSPEQRRAHFTAALCLAWPDGHTEDFEGQVDGVVAWPPRGDKGFGYDPLFKPDGFDRTFGEMSAEEKHGLPPTGMGLSHRARAFLKLADACLRKS
jgi:XTP/dITP diphosphohydrolase